MVSVSSNLDFAVSQAPLLRVGVGPRRRWSDEIKGRIVTQSYAPGTAVADVARRHDISQHLFVWRRAHGPVG
jgi:transposase-like protein